MTTVDHQKKIIVRFYSPALLAYLVATILGTLKVTASQVNNQGFNELPRLNTTTVMENVVLPGYTMRSVTRSVVR